MDDKTPTTGRNNRVTTALLVLGIMALPSVAHAQLFGTGDNFMNAVLAFLTGGFARTVAVVGVIILGVLAIAGRLEMKRALTVIAGIILIFGAAAIVDGIAGAV